MIKFSPNVQEWLDQEYPGIDFEKMSLEELKVIKDDLTSQRQQLRCREDSTKNLGNSAYGACANPSFYFYNMNLAADITGECRFLTKFMWERNERFFHEDIWERKDLWEKFDIDLDMSKHEWYKQQPVSIYSDTDSCSQFSQLVVNHKDMISKFTFINLWNITKNIYPTSVKTSGHEVMDIDGALSIPNYINGQIQWTPVRKLIRHKVTKSRFKIRTKSGKEIIVTGDHSCIVFRDGKQITIKAKDINKETDKILTLSHEMS